ncbi:MAG: mevalonate kinase [Candidatus Bathyarchaeia archaeon]
MEALAIAPAKTILFGEHFVVLGKPAIAMAIGLYAYVSVKEFTHGIHVESTKLNSLNRKSLKPIKLATQSTLDYLGISRVSLKIDINSFIPIGVGLGSSAAVSVATIAAITRFFGIDLDRKKIHELAFIPEKEIHGKPSGIDQTTSIYGGIIFFKPNKGFERIPCEELQLIIGNTKITRSTKTLVNRVKELLDKNKDYVIKLQESYESLYDEAIKAIKLKDFNKIGELMIKNHELLKKLGVSHEILDKFVEKAIEAGAFGAKLTGAGGGGCMIALADKERMNRVAEALCEIGGEVIIANIDKEGVRTKILRGNLLEY